MLGAPFAGACVKCDKLTPLSMEAARGCPDWQVRFGRPLPCSCQDLRGDKCHGGGGVGGAGMTRGPLHLPCLTSEMTRPDTQLASLASQAGDDTGESGFTSGR